MEMKIFGNPAGKYRVFLSIKVPNLKHSWDVVIYCKYSNRDNVARLLRNIRRARSEVKKIQSSRTLGSDIFPPYSLRWLVCHSYEIYIVDENDNSRTFRRSAVYLDSVIFKVQ